MATIFPLSASIGQIYQGYSYNGTAWEIIGEDWKPNTYSPNPPDYAEAGYIWIDSDEDVPELDSSSFISASGYAVLTNKTISGSNNTLSNIPQSAVTNLVSNLSSKQDVVSGVSNTEIGYLDGVTSGIQNQLDSKLGIISASNTYLTQVSASTVYATKASPTLTNTTLSGNTNITGTTSINEIEETVTVSATAAGGTINYDVLTNRAITFYTTNASANWTLNVRGNSGTTLNSILSNGQSLTIVFMATNGATAYYQTGFQIDGVSVTPKWQSGSAPTSGNINSIDTYTFTIVKTASATYTVLASQTRFA